MTINSINSRLFWVLLLFAPLSATITFDPNKLKKQAEIEGLGYKTANLQVLESIANQINYAMPPYHVAIPNFVGISDRTIHQYLKKQNVDISHLWKEMLKKTAGPHQQEKMLKRKQLSQKFKQELEILQKKIIGSFTSQPLSPHSQLTHFLQAAKKKRWALMVRSTGKEDSESLANAGGNESIANVPATETHVMHAMGEVLASYLSTKSIQQRLQAGDSSVFETPFLPVLIQRMIGEPIGGTKNEDAIPTSCVLYTTETDGFTPGISLAQATFGHNEGVVQSSMPLDSFYLGKEATYSSIKNKTKRLIPALEQLKYTLAEHQNSAGLAQRASLSSQALQSLYIIAQEVEKFYTKPMDLELVVMPEEKTIYLVQARPIVIPQTKSPPRYLKNINDFQTAQRIPCTIINSNRGVLLEKVAAHQLIIEKTLEKALVDFNNLQEDKDEILAIAVEEEAEATSHAAAVFRGEGKVIIRLSSGIQQLESLMTQPKAKIIISTQQGMVINLTDQQDVQSAQIATGLASHPANIPLSIAKKQPAWPKFIFSRIKGNQPVSKIIQELKSNPKNQKLLNELCSSVSMHDKFVVHKDLYSATSVVNSEVSKKRKALEQFIIAITQAIKESTNKEELAFHMRMLELATTQEENSGYINVYSHQTLRKYAKKVSNFLNNVIAPALKAEDISPAVIQDPVILSLAQAGYNQSLTPTVQRAWFHFIDQHARNKLSPQHAVINKLLMQLQEQDLLAGWINTSIAQAMQQVTDRSSAAYQEVANNLVLEFEHAQEHLTMLNKIQESMSSMPINDWENFSKFATLFAQLSNNVNNALSSEAFEELLTECEQSSNNLLKLAVITVLKKITDRYDLFIKAIKSSTQYPDKPSKVKNFHAMLEGYVTLLEKISSNQTLLTALKDRLNDYDEESEDELVISKHFNVNVIVQQNETAPESANAFTRRKFFDYIETLEDLFTSTHQLLLSEISKKIVGWNITKAIDMPELVEAIQDELDLEDQLTGINFQGNQVIFTYNRKLRAHSVQIEVSYDCSNKKAVLSYHFYGFNEFLRWNLIKDYITLVSPKLNLSIERIVSRDYGLSIYWHVPTTLAIQTLNEFLEDAIDITFELAIENRKKIFLHLEDTLENLYEKCEELYGSQKALIKALAATISQPNFNLLTLSALNEIAEQYPQSAKIIFKQGIDTATQIIDSESHDNLVTAHYILAEIVDAAENFDQDATQKIKLPKRTRLAKYKTYHKIVSNLLDKVERLVAKLD